MQPADLSAESRETIARAFEALDRGIGIAVPRLAAPRRYAPDRVPRALEAMVAQLAGYAIGLVGAAATAALVRQHEPAIAAAVRAELARIAAAPPVVRARTTVATLERGLAPPPLLTPDALREHLRERLVHARVEAQAVVLRLASAALAAAPAARARIVAGLATVGADDLVPYRFGERIEVAWGQTCEACARDRPPTAPPAPQPASAEEPTENYCWMRIR